VLRSAGECLRHWSGRPVNGRATFVRARFAQSGYAALVIEEEHAEDTTSTSLGEAIEDLKGKDPSLAQALGSAGMTPDKLAEARQRAASGENEGQPEQS
jgi:hypothetical protein